MCYDSGNVGGGILLPDGSTTDAMNYICNTPNLIDIITNV